MGYGNQHRETQRIHFRALVALATRDGIIIGVLPCVSKRTGQGRNEVTAMTLLGHGHQKYPEARVASSSAPRSWTGLAAELRCHQAVELPKLCLPQMEVAIATRRSPQAVVSRTGDGVQQQTRVQPGTIWLCPFGVTEEDVRITAPIEVLHIYLPSARFDQLSELQGGTAIRAQSIRYMAGVDDELVRQIGRALLEEIGYETAAGRVLVESLAVSLTARLAAKYSADQPVILHAGYQRHGLDETRVRRVLDYIAAHIEDDIGLDDLASVACLSPFHFSRMFRNRMGVPPHRYISNKRLERAKTLLSRGVEPLSEVALSCRFSSQSSFTRAFRLATGMTPGDFRTSSK